MERGEEREGKEKEEEKEMGASLHKPNFSRYIDPIYKWLPI